MSFLKRSMNILKGIAHEATQSPDAQKIADLDQEMHQEAVKKPSQPQKIAQNIEIEAPQTTKKKEPRSPKKRTL